MKKHAVPQGSLGYLTIWPTGQEQPTSSPLNSLDGRVKANAALVGAGTRGDVTVFVTNTSDIVLDIDGYFTAADQSTLAFYPLPPCRVADTRTPGGIGGPYLTGGIPRSIPILDAMSCNIPSQARAYSLNFTAVPHGRLGYLTVWPTGQNQPNVSTLNAPTGTATADAAIVPAGANGEISVFAHDDTDLIIDINGYFAPPGQGGLSLYRVLPCRVFDTRQTTGAFSGRLYPAVDIIDYPCNIWSIAEAYVLMGRWCPAARCLTSRCGLTAQISRVSSSTPTMVSSLPIWRSYQRPMAT